MLVVSIAVDVPDDVAKVELALRKIAHESTDYSAIIFDCDGVILDSNRVKTDAFRLVAEPMVMQRRICWLIIRSTTVEFPATLSSNT